MERRGDIAAGLDLGLQRGRARLEPTMRGLVTPPEVRANLPLMQRAGVAGAGAGGVTFHSPVSTHRSEELAPFVVQRHRDAVPAGWRTLN